MVVFQSGCGLLWNQGSLPSAQTERRGGAGPVGACLTVRAPPAALLLMLPGSDDANFPDSFLSLF
jgi:hypothetical protein